MMSSSSINNTSSSYRGGDVSETQDMTEATSFRINNPQSNNSTSADAQEIMKDNLDIMREIVMRIRDDEEFAASIYADCPRLQHHLELRPDLRPIFEDPNLVRINFEQVYREAGGKLPEDDVEDKKKIGFKAILAKIVNSPFFKVLRVILLVKKIVSCATGGGVSMVRGVFQNMCCQSAAAAGGLDAPDLDADGTADAPNVGNEETKAALNRVAEHMEDPEVHQHMTELLENDPDGLDEAIQNDPELSALRDSNPLCAELMKDPETMRILVDPDNLRALGECPDLIEQDFANPDWTPPDVETGGTGGMDTLVDVDGMDDVEVDVDGDGIDVNGDGIPDQDIDGDGDIDADDLDGGDGDGDVDADGDEEEDDGNMMDDYEMGDADDNNNPEMSKGQGGGGQRSRNQNRSGGQGRVGGFMSQIGAGFTDMAASQIVGFSMGDIMGGGDIPGLDNLDGLDDADGVDAPDDIDTSGVEDAADQAGIDGDTQANAAASAIDNANSLLNDSYGDQLDSLEKGMDDLEGRTEGLDGGDQAAQAAQGQSQAQARSMAVGGAAAGVAAAEVAIIGTGMIGGNENTQNRDGKEEDSESKSRFGWIGNLGSAIATAAKETVASAVLGDDLGQMVVEKQEERSEREGEDQVHNGKKKP